VLFPVIDLTESSLSVFKCTLKLSHHNSIRIFAEYIKVDSEKSQSCDKKK